MRLISQKSLPFLGLACLLIAAVFSKGFHHFDEHFQILEFAALKLGLTTEDKLPWEFHEQMRSALQPSLVVVFHKILSPTGMENPFLITLLLRILTACLSWLAILGMMRSLGASLKNYWLMNFVVPFSFFFCISVYNGVRFSSENWGGLFFVLGLSLITGGGISSKSTSFLSGLLLGLSFLSRFQMGLMIMGLGLWLVFVKKESLKLLLFLAMGFSLVLLSGVLIDHWFYGNWPITFWNYLRLNLIEGKAARFGIQPWYEYFKLLLIYLFPPFSVFFVFGLLSFFWLYPTHVFTFCLLPFLLIHSWISHKEVRFLFPLLYFFPVLLGMVFQKINEQFDLEMKAPLVLKGSYWAFWILNSFALMIVLFHPADKDIALYEAVYRSGASALYFQGEGPFNRAGGIISYYRLPGFPLNSVSSLSEVRPPSSTSVLFATAQRNQIPQLSSDKIVYRSVPDWIVHFNFNHWVERSKLWTVWRVN